MSTPLSALPVFSENVVGLIQPNPSIHDLHCAMRSPMVSADLDRVVLEEGIFYEGRLAGQKYKVVIAHPEDAPHIYTVSETEIAMEALSGKANLKPRSITEIADNTVIDMTTPGKEKGGLTVLLLLEDNRIGAMGSIVLNSVGRGRPFSKCPLNEQISMSMAVTHPDYQGLGFISKIFRHRLQLATLFSKEEGFAHPRQFVVAKIANKKTQAFYLSEEQGFEQDGPGEILPDVPKPDHLLLTLGKNMSDICAQVQKHPQGGNKTVTLETLFNGPNICTSAKKPLQYAA